MASTSNPYQITPKQPGEILDYDFDFSLRLAPSADVVATGVVTCPDTGLVLGETQVSPTVVKQWASGGVSGVVYHLTCMVTTVGGRVMEMDMFIPVKEF